MPGWTRWTQRAAAAGERMRPLARGLRGAAVESAWLAAHCALYPLGVAAERTRALPDRYTLAGLSPVRRALLLGDLEAAGTPILLLHGLVDNRSIFALLRRGLHRRGFDRVVGLNYPVRTADVRVAARVLAAEVERICADSGYEQVHVVGHSLGGLIARYYVQALGGDSRVHTLVTLGTPHRGTHAARLLPHHLGRQLRPGSDLYAELDALTGPCRTRFVAVYSDLDQLIVPPRAARLDLPRLTCRNVLVRGVAHLSLPIDSRVVHEICTTLAHLDATGRPLATELVGRGGGRREPAARTRNRSAAGAAG